MGIRNVLFPAYHRSFPGKRWVSILLRTGHLIGVAGIGGGYLFSYPLAQWQAYLDITVATGLGMMLLDVWSNGVWLVQLRGVAILAKLMLLGGVRLYGEHAGAIVIAAIVISGLISHAPARVRYYSVFHRRRVDELPAKA